MDLPAPQTRHQFPVPLLDVNSAQDVPPTRLFSLVLRRKWLILGLAAMFFAPAVAVVRGLPEYYDATALLLVNTHEASLRDLQATVASPDSDLVAVATQVGLIKSPTLAQRVVKQLDLVHSPEFERFLVNHPSLLQRAMSLLPQQLQWQSPPAVELTDAQKQQVTANVLMGMVSILNDGKSYIISVRARSENPKLSAAIANSYVATYLEFKEERKVAAIRRANALLDDQIAPIAARVTKAEQAVESYRATNGLIVSRPFAGSPNETGGGTTIADQQLAQINAQLVTASGELAEKQASLSQIEAAMRDSRMDASPEVMSSALISSLRAQQAELSSRVAGLGQSQLDHSPSYRSAVAAEREIEQRINSEIAKIAASVRSQVNASRAKVQVLQAALARLQGQVGTQSEANVTLRQLESEAAAARTIYQDYLSRFERTLNQANVQDAEADQVSAAEVPLAKTGPRRSLLLALAFALSIGLASVLALMFERLRGGVRTLEELEASSGLLGLGYLPVAQRSLRRIFRSGRPSMYSEAVRSVASLLQFGQEHYRARIVLVTSAIPNEGKTFFAISLAAAVGAEGRSALLIECDIRRPSIARTLNIKGKPSSTDMPAVLHASVLPGVDVVTLPRPAGGRRGIVPSQVQKLIDEARSHYDMIVLDTPPVLPFADTPMLSLKADGAIMVVRWRRTPAAVVHSAVKVLSAYGVRILGGVVTQVQPKDVNGADDGQGHMYRHYASYFR
jgi:uncharacterized protein involved in exopolysaccharide biosynthesis/Mrp family chromosome partitioning ATPase